ncbi:MAG: IclR family transcriptional regulator [Actinomycetota bacterium]|nr:IclR family transcriptional regulator [Actinomycetota bacterium]
MRRGTDILIALGGEEALARDGLGVVRIAQLVGHEKSQVSRALTALAASGLVDRDPQSRAYRLGWRLFALAARSGRPRLISLAPSTLRRLVADYGETVHLSVLDGSQVLTLLSEGPSTAIKATGWSGRTVPVTCTSSGRALLLDHDRLALGAIVDQASFAGLGPNAPHDADELHRRICAAREQGYALVDEEFEPGLVGVAAPVRDFSGQIMAVLNVSGPKFRLDGRLGSAGEDLRRAADALSNAMSARLP